MGAHGRSKIQKTWGAKKQQFFWFSLGVLQEFSRKANEDGAGRRQKTNAGGGGGRRRQIQKTREQKMGEAIFLVCNHPGKRMRGGGGEGEGGSDGVENTGAKKKQFFCLHGSRKTNAGGWGGAATLENTRAGGDNRSREIREKKMQFFFVFLGVFVWIFSEIKRG